MQFITKALICNNPHTINLFHRTRKRTIVVYEGYFIGRINYKRIIYNKLFSKKIHNKLLINIDRSNFWRLIYK